ncbi:hypothetical protein KY317_01465, partial [Candidatus Woesearchaeota archaeon]|nr:hypothetical protein [Candidatus Woesearchaeota archaeon]
MLSGKELIRNAEKVIKEHPEYFEALMEFERTKKLPRLEYKERANFTIDSRMLRKFREYCRKKGMKMSAKIEQYIEKELA